MIRCLRLYLHTKVLCEKVAYAVLLGFVLPWQTEYTTYIKFCVDSFFQASSPGKSAIRISFTNVEDKAEGALRARVAQQSEVISLLKSRSDDTLLQVMYRARV